MNIKHIGGIIQSLLLIVYLSFEPIHYQLVLASSGLLLQLIALKWIQRQELLVEMASWLLIIPMAIIIINVQSAIFITVQLLYMKPSKFLFLRITFIILFAIVLDSEIHTLILTIVSLIIYILVPILEQPKVSSSPSQSTKKSASESEQESHIKMHFRSLICSECNPEQRTNIQDQFLQIFDQFPDGVVIVTFDENRLPIIEFSNSTILNLLNTSQQDLLITLMSLKNLRVMKKNEQQKDLALSISTLRSQYPTSDKPTIGVVRKMVRAATTFHQQSNEHFVNGKLKFSKNPFQIALEQAILQIHSHDVQMLLEKTQIAFDLHTILYGYTQKGKRDIHLEIKLFISFLNNKPKLLILTRDVSYKDYIKIINQHSKAKSNSLNFVTHELRTPLNCIIQLLEELDQKNDNIKTALLNCQYLYNFSNDLMDLAQIKVGKFQLNKKEFNLENLIFSVFELFKVESKRNKIDLKIDYAMEVPRQIFNDERRVKQVLINLIGNAFKFTVDGSITVKVEINQDNTLQLSIIDTGLGVREEDKKKLLKAFGKLEDDESKNCNRNGVGLGLLISNMICKSLSTKETGINIDSQLYKGSTFAFVIDYKIDFDQVNSQIHETESFIEDVDLCVQPRIQRIYSNQAFRQRELLIIDDNTFNIDMLVRLFNINGITRIDYAINCHNALQIIDKNIQNYIFYRLILLDIEMPIINGFETAKMIKQYVDETMATMPIIIGISGHGMYMKEEALANGFKDYYEKPLKVSDVQQIISRYLC